MFSIRAAVVDDVPLLKRLIHELAEYEQEPDAILLTEENLIHDGFGPKSKFRAIIAEECGQPAGYALFFDFYSTWTGSGIYLEDLFVRPVFRGHGIGKALLGQVALIARQEGCHTIRLDVLDSNETAIKFYQSLGGAYLEQWRNVLIEEEVLGRLALEVQTRG
ncbi:MAG: GNAT family N-acetyltransferase [Candidatus Sulfotelmatobacter sp.]